MIVRDLLMRWASRIPGIPSDMFDWWKDTQTIATEAQRQRIEDEAGMTNPQDMSRWITTPNGRRKRPHWNGGTR